MALASVVAAGLTVVRLLHAAAQAPLEECATGWSAFEAAAKANGLQAAAAAEKQLATVPGCSRQRASAKEAMLGLYRGEAARLKRDDAPPARQLAVLETALAYGNAWNVWDIYAGIGDLRRQLPSAGGAPDSAAVSLAYDAAVRAIDLAPRAARPPAAEIERLVRLAYQYEALSPTPVPRRGLLTRTARQIDVERTPVPLQFVYDTDRLTEAGQAQAENLLRLLKDEGLPPLHLVGHTDPVGSDAYNDRLSVLRAAAVKRFLVAGGYPADRIATEGRGKRDIDKLRIVDKSAFTTEQIHQMLRRVELVWKTHAMKVERNAPVLAPGGAAAAQRPGSLAAREADAGPVRLRIVGMTAAEQMRVASSLNAAVLVGEAEPAALIWDAGRRLILNDQGHRIAEDVDVGGLQSAIDRRRALERLIGLSAENALAVRIRLRDEPPGTPPSAASEVAHKPGTILYIDLGDIPDGAYFAVFNLTGNGKIELIEPAAFRDRCEGPDCAGGARKVRGVPIEPLEVQVRAPFGAEHVVALAGALPLSRLMPALALAHGKFAVAEVMSALAAELQTQPLQAGFRGFYSTRE
jgi:outer membrane protein OmpA-like peptidoglycan-associated protein